MISPRLTEFHLVYVYRDNPFSESNPGFAKSPYVFPQRQHPHHTAFDEDTMELLGVVSRTFSQTLITIYINAQCRSTYG